MKLYYTQGACSLVCRITINELNLPCEFESVDLRSKKTESGKDFLTVNPKGYIPVLKLDDGHILTENAVILQYLADTHKATNLLPAIGKFERYQVLEWLNFCTTEMHKGIGVMFNPAITQSMKEEIFIPAVKKKLDFLNKHLEHSTWLCGDHFMLPDAYMFVMLFWLGHFKVDVKNWPHLSRYFDDLNKRPSIQKSIKQEF